jgi:hypothetical protein
MADINLTEQVLTRTWFATPDNYASWLDRFEEFVRIAKVLHFEGCPVGADLFSDAADMAMARATFAMRMPRSTLEEVPA